MSKWNWVAVIDGGLIGGTVEGEMQPEETVRDALKAVAATVHANFAQMGLGFNAVCVAEGELYVEGSFAEEVDLSNLPQVVYQREGPHGIRIKTND